MDSLEFIVLRLSKSQNQFQDDTCITLFYIKDRKHARQGSHKLTRSQYPEEKNLPRSLKPRTKSKKMFLFVNISKFKGVLVQSSVPYTLSQKAISDVSTCLNPGRLSTCARKKKPINSSTAKRTSYPLVLPLKVHCTIQST